MGTPTRGLSPRCNSVITVRDALNPVTARPERMLLKLRGPPRRLRRICCTDHRSLRSPRAHPSPTRSLWAMLRLARARRRPLLFDLADELLTISQNGHAVSSGSLVGTRDPGRDVVLDIGVDVGAGCPDR